MQTLRREINEKMHRLKLKYYDAHTHGDILSVLTNDVDTLKQYHQPESYRRGDAGDHRHRRSDHDVFHQSEAFPDPHCDGAPFPLSAAGVMKASEKYYSEQQELLGRLNGYVEEMYNSQSVVQTFNYQERAKNAFPG